jgi:hypothetical protein
VETRSSVLLLLLVVLCGAAVTVLAVEARDRPDRSEPFQRLVGGVGFGPALDLSGCAFGFDPRLEGSCAEEYGPVPGGSCFCPRHAGSLLSYPPLRRGEPGHAPVP